jgi:hypothetical protein
MPAAPVAPTPAAPAPPAEPRGTEASSTGDDGGTVTSFSVSRAGRARGARPSGVRWLAVAAAGLVVAAMTGGAVGYLVGTSRDDDADIGTLAERAGEDPEGVLATLDDSGGRPVARVVGDDDGAYLVLEGLQDLPEGRAYQLWSLTGPEPVSLGMLGRDGSNTVAFRLPPTITELAISEEPTIGESAPTGQFEASGSIRGQATPS